MICSAVASSHFYDEADATISNVARRLGASNQARDVVDHVTWSADLRYMHVDLTAEERYVAVFADAEALLRTGWTP
jgi:hypothetical protein